MENNFTNKVEETLAKMIDLAKNSNHSNVDIVHYLKIVINDANSLLNSILKKCSVDVKSVKNDIDSYYYSINKTNNDTNFSSDMNKLLNDANQYKNKMKDKYISSEHLILALFDSPNTLAKKIINSYNLNKINIEKIINDIRGDKMVNDKNTEESYEVLEKYGRDLVKLVSDGKIDPVIGRDEEIRRIMEILRVKSPVF